MTKLTFTKDDPPPPESLPDAPRARAASAAAAAPPEAPGEDAAVDTDWTAEDAAFNTLHQEQGLADPVGMNVAGFQVGAQQGRQLGGRHGQGLGPGLSDLHPVCQAGGMEADPLRRDADMACGAFHEEVPVKGCIVLPGERLEPLGCLAPHGVAGMSPGKNSQDGSAGECSKFDLPGHVDQPPCRINGQAATAFPSWASFKIETSSCRRGRGQTRCRMIVT